MSIQNEIDRINNNVQATLQTIADTGVSVGTNSDALPAAAAALANEKANVNHTHNCYGVCTTAADVAAKTVDIAGFQLKTGAAIAVKFNNANSVASPTLNVSGTGAYPIRRYGTTAVSTGTTTSGWIAGAIQVFIFDGAAWVRDYWNNTTYSNASLGSGYATCSTAAATAAKVASLSSYALATGGIVAVKFTYDVPANATLNINSKGAKAIYYRGAKITSGVIKAGDIATFVYSSYYHLISIDRDENTTYSAATSSAAGLMSAADKNKIDNLPDVLAFYGVALTFANNQATFSDSRIKANSVVICSRRAGSKQNDIFSVNPAAGSVTISSTATASGTINVNMIIVNN